MNNSNPERFTTEQLFQTPAVYPADLDISSDTLTFVHMSRQTYQEYAFHDDRILQHEPESHKVRLEDLLSWYRAHLPPQRRVNYIFHTAFCGSTLLARYLDQPNRTFVHREPYVLTQLAMYYGVRQSELDRWQKILAMMVILLSRTSSYHEVPVIKLHDGCNNLVGELLALHPASRGLILYSDLRAFLLSTLKHADRRKWVRSRLQWGIDGIESLAAIDKSALTDAEAAACLWLAQMYTCIEALERHAGQLGSLHCSMLFQSPEEALQLVTSHLGIPFSPETITQIIKHQGKIHAKSGEKYDPVVRAAQDNLLAKLHDSEIQKALEWSESASARQPLPIILPQSIC